MRARSFGAVATLLLLTFWAPRAALAAASGVTGHIASVDGTPIANAVVVLEGNGPIERTRSDAAGNFSVEAPSGTYTISVFARGYDGGSGRTITLPGDRKIDVRFDLARGQVSSLIPVAEVHSNGTALLSASSAPSVSVNAQTYAAQGVERTSDILSSELSTTVYPVIGGGLNAPAVVALRGPDPSETLVDVDGHQVNNGSTGDFDLSLLDPADLQHVEVVYGIAPSALFGPNTLGGALNVVTLQPTTQTHTLERLSLGTFGTDSGTLATTGTDDRLGYAFSIHRLTSAGQLANSPFPNTSSAGGSSVGTSPIGNDMSATSSLANLKYLFTNGGFVGFSFHNQTAYRNLSATLSSTCAPGDCTITNPSGTSVPNPTEQYSNASGSSLSSNDDAYGLDLQLPVGRQTNGVASTTATFRHETSYVTQVVTGSASGSSPYLYNDRDLISDDTLEFDHPLPKGSLALKFALTNENLVTDNVLGVIYADAAVRKLPEALPDDSVTTGNPYATIPTLGQTQRWAGASYTFDPSAKLHYSLASYYSDYSSFGHSFDPRLGIVWTPTADTAVRGSIGNTFQSPQLPTFIIPGRNTPIPVIDGYASIGNAAATAERATSMDLGFEHVVHVGDHDVHVALDVYRTNLHNGVATYFGPHTCSSPTVTLASDPACLTYPVNVTHEVYQGVELRTDYQLHPKTALHVNYDIDSAYVVSFPGSAADDVVPYVQDLGVPLHKLSIAIEHDPSGGLSYYAGLLYEGTYNELDLPPYATLRAGVTWHLPHVDIALVGENLTNAYDFLTTRENGGVPYQSSTYPGLQPTIAYPLAGRRFSLIFTHKT